MFEVSLKSLGNHIRAKAVFMYKAMDLIRIETLWF